MDGNNKESFYTILNGHAGDKSDRSKSDDLDHKEKTSDFAEDRRFHPGIRGVVSETISKSNSTNSSCAEHNYNKQQTFLNKDFKREPICAASIFRDRLPENNTPEGNVTYIKDVKDTGAVPKQKNKCMSFSDLKELIEKSADEILFIILNKESGFVRLLEEKLERDNMAYVLSLLGKAVSSAMNKNVIEMMNIVTSNSSFFLIKVQQYLSSFKQADSHDIHLDSILNLIIFLQKFQISLPSNACDVLLILLPLVKQISENYLIHDKRFCSESSAMIREIEESNNSILFKYSPNQMKQISKNEKLQLLEPPENYRTIPILPNELDIQQSFAFLRPSVIKGRYQNTEHYLDVQYRLLREDYVRPLRDGITEYLVFKKQNKSTKRIKDARVYPEVKLLKQEFVNGELLHMAFFNDKKFAKIKWEFSKRLLGKSLLCLSADEFKTMFFATIAQRDPKQLVKGFLMLRFEELTDEILNLQSSTNFVVIETDAYFESYRYNLDVLLKLNERTFPMKRYIIETQKVVEKPQYLTDATTYDMRPLLLPINRASRMKMIDKFGNYNHDYIYPANIPKRMENVPVLDSDSWPTCGELNLDTSQYSALKAAVTKEFAVIQGPPGTGKTYIGLRIAQLLLHNVHKWRSRTNPSPILVLCYTNHALDQFLEGIINFTDQIVRIGSRGTNEAVSHFQINNLKRSNIIRTEMSYRIGDKMQELRRKKNSVDEAKSFLANSFSSILNENILQECMTPYQYSSLRNKKNSFNRIPMYHWLMNIQINNKQAPAFLPKYRPLWNEAPPDVESSDEDSEEAADIEYIEAQRDINSAEYEGVSYDLPLYKDEINAIFGLEDGWQLVGGKGGLKNYVNRCLIETRAMHKREAKNIRDVWVLNYKQRWRLYKFWLESFIDKVNKLIPKLHQEIREGYRDLQNMRMVEDIIVCRHALVVGMTITGAAKHRHIVQVLNPMIVIVEEAAEVLESHIVTSLAPGTEHLILIGDHQQLKPSPTVYELATKFGMNVSLFERMVENGLDCYKLEIQHRMRPEIASQLVPHIYTKLLNHESVKNMKI